MVEVYLDMDEWYPVFTVAEHDQGAYRVVVDAETLARWEHATALFTTTQNEMSAAVDAARKREDSSPLSETAA